MAIGALYNSANVNVGQAAVFVGAANAPCVPTTVAGGWVATDPFLLAPWTTADASWTQAGATDQGWQFQANKNTQTINIEEQSTPVATTITSQSVTVTGALSEDMTQQLLWAFNAQKTTVAPTTLVYGTDTIVPTDIVQTYALALVTTNPQGFGRIIYAPLWTQLSNVSVNFRRAADKKMYAVGFQTICATSAIKIINFTANHS